jgi:biopolymer transport protein ExbD
MAGTLGGAGRARTISGINVTPLVDVVLVLLVILMVASTYIVSQTLKVQLPKSKNTDGAADKPTTVTLMKDGEVKFNNVAVPDTELEEKLKAAAELDPDLSLVVSADKEVHHGNVVHVLDLAKSAGISKFAINVQQGNP